MTTPQSKQETGLIIKTLGLLRGFLRAPAAREQAAALFFHEGSPGTPKKEDGAYQMGSVRAEKRVHERPVRISPKPIIDVLSCLHLLRPRAHIILEYIKSFTNMCLGY